MSHWDDPSIPYGHKWALDLDAFCEDDAFQTLLPAGKEFVVDLIREIRERPVRERDSYAVCTPFTSALMTMLRAHGFQPDNPARSVTIADIVPKRSDVSFTFKSISYVIEIKTGLEFNSLSAAVLEAIAFKLAEPKTHFSLVALYAYDEAACNVREVLAHLGMPTVFDSISILTRNKDEHDGTWSANLSAAINELIAGLPVA